MRAHGIPHRIQAVKAEAFELGYRLFVDEAYNIELVTHMAFAASASTPGAVTARFLAYGTSAAGAAESGLEVLRGIVEDGKPWPE
jgi:hypothetical protein